MTCGSCKHEDVRDEQPCTGCSHGRYWEPKEDKIVGPLKPKEDKIVGPLKALAFSLHRRTDEHAAEVCDAAVAEIERLREANARLQREADRPGIMWCNEP